MLGIPGSENRESAVNIASVFAGGGDFDWSLTPEDDKGPENTALLVSQSHPHVLAHMLLACLMQWWQGNSSQSSVEMTYHGGRNKATFPTNVWERIAEYLHESFTEIIQGASLFR